jgi:hypothetical protein
MPLLDRDPPQSTEFLCCDPMTESTFDQCLSGLSAHNNFLPIIIEMCSSTFDLLSAESCYVLEGR